MLVHSIITTILTTVDHNELLPDNLWDRPSMVIAMRVLPYKLDLKLMSRVLIILGVISVSDASTPTGASLDTSYLSSTSNMKCRNNLSWPTKHHVTLTDFTPDRSYYGIYVGTVITAYIYCWWRIRHRKLTEINHVRIEIKFIGMHLSIKINKVSKFIFTNRCEGYIHLVRRLGFWL